MITNLFLCLISFKYFIHQSWSFFLPQQAVFQILKSCHIFRFHMEETRNIRTRFHSRVSSSLSSKMPTAISMVVKAFTFQCWDRLAVVSTRKEHDSNSIKNVTDYSTGIKSYTCWTWFRLHHKSPAIIIPNSPKNKREILSVMSTWGKSDSGCTSFAKIRIKRSLWSSRLRFGHEANSPISENNILLRVGD